MILNDETFKESQEYGELLADFLEHRICVLLNLPSTKEYFLHYSLAQNGRDYHCILLDKELLKAYVKNADIYLSHPIFLYPFSHDTKTCLILLDSYCTLSVVVYEAQKIIAFSLVEISKLLEKLEALQSLYAFNILSFWALSEIPQALKEILETLEVTIHNIQLQTLTLPQSYNFNPFERRIPFLRSHSGIAVKSFAGGIMLSGLILISIIGAIFLQRQENQHLQETLNALEHNRTNVQKEIHALQTQLQELKIMQETNALVLKDFSLNLKPAFWLQTLSAYCAKLQVKIAYFALEDSMLSLLLIGQNTLKVLEVLEKQALASVQSLETYGGFTWVEARDLKGAYGDS